MSEERDRYDFVEDIMLSSDEAIIFVEGMTFDDFRIDKKTINAVVRSLEVIGEATKHLPDSFRSEHPEIPWRQLAGMRDRLIHGYFGVDLEIVWDTVQQLLPQLLDKTNEILKTIEQGDKTDGTNQEAGN
jgi:uncharacterized protein with HEPN domain